MLCGERRWYGIVSAMLAVYVAGRLSVESCSAAVRDAHHSNIDQFVKC